jgi:hypothetical protein
MNCLARCDHLRTIEEENQLLMKLREKVVKYTIKALKNACMRAGWTDQARTEAWANGGYYT